MDLATEYVDDPAVLEKQLGRLFAARNRQLLLDLTHLTFSFFRQGKSFAHKFIAQTGRTISHVNGSRMDLLIQVFLA
jgi:hypothetical protein